MVLGGGISNIIWIFYGFLIKDLIVILPAIISELLCNFQTFQQLFHGYKSINYFLFHQSMWHYFCNSF